MPLGDKGGGTAPHGTLWRVEMLLPENVLTTKWNNFARVFQSHLSVHKNFKEFTSCHHGSWDYCFLFFVDFIEDPFHASGG